MHAFARAGATISPEQAIFMVLQLLQGLDYAHRKTDAQGKPLQVVHCDVSPDNCLVSFEGEVKLLDFGIARAATSLSNYKEGMLMGKLGYVAPEQASLETRWDHRVDIFASGIILYELLTKQKPFPKATDVETLVASRKAKVVPPSTLDPRLPKELDQILARALAYDPSRRYGEARAFAEALVDVLFPTPHSSVQDLLNKQMHQVFADRIAKQRQARAHDALIMKVLSNIADRPPEVAPALPGQPATRSSDPVELEPLAQSGLASAEARPAPSASRASRAIAVAPARRTSALALALAAGLGLAVGAAGAWLAAPWLRTGTVVATSEPAGVEVALDGAPTGQRTPAVLDQVNLTRPHELTFSGTALRSATLPVQAPPGGLVARVHATLHTTLGTLTVESDPPGAEVLLDEKLVGATPVSVPRVRLDERHRIDLRLPGYEMDQVMILPEKDGAKVHRTLTAILPPRKAR